MLILTRKENEAIMIGTEISVVILEIKGNQVRVGISAPKETKILREELKEYKTP